MKKLNNTEIQLMKTLKKYFDKDIGCGDDLENILDYIESKTNNKSILEVVRSCDEYLEQEISRDYIKNMINKILKV